jgi:hypothetical protein
MELLDMRSTAYFQNKLYHQKEGMAVGNALSLVVSNSFMEHSEEVANRLCGLVASVPGYRSRGPGSILDATRFSEK